MGSSWNGAPYACRAFRAGIVTAVGRSSRGGRAWLWHLQFYIPCPLGVEPSPFWATLSARGKTLPEHTEHL